MRRIKELEKKVNKEKKKSNAVLSGFQGYLSSRHLKKVPMGLESPDTSFEGVSLKKKKSRKKFRKAIKSALHQQDLDNIKKIKTVSIDLWKPNFSN